MPAIWRPNLRGELCDVDVEVNATEEEVTKKGTKRKRAHYTKGPCEHGVKYRSKCKVCSACPHGKWRWLCKECGGSQICVHGRERSLCKECGGGGNLRAWPSALYVQGVRRVEKIEWRAEKVNFNRKSNSATAALIVGI